MKHPIEWPGHFGIAALVLTLAFFAWAVFGNWLGHVATPTGIYVAWWAVIAVCAALNYTLPHKPKA
jgi:hypothetical protein